MNKAYGSLRECCPQGPQLSAMKASIFKVGQYRWECSSGLCATSGEEQSFPP